MNILDDMGVRGKKNQEKNTHGKYQDILIQVWTNPLSCRWSPNIEQVGGH